MRRRPQPSRRRGFLRAIAAFIVLLALLVAILLIVSTLTAPPAKAPVVPGSPTPGLLPTPTSSKGKVTPTPGKKGRAHTPTAKKGALSAPLSVQDHSGAALADAVFAVRHARLPASGTGHGDLVAFFRESGSAYARTPLQIMNRRTGKVWRIGYGDRFVRPVWSADGRHVLYVRVRPAGRVPGAVWSLMESGMHGGSRALASRLGTSVSPLGEVRGHVFYALSTSVATDVYDLHYGRSTFVSIVMPQILTSLLLSPDSRYVAFAAPTGCSFCTVDVYDLLKQEMMPGASGAPSEIDLAWTRDGRDVVSRAKADLAILDVYTGALRYVRAPAGLPRVWSHEMRAIVSPRSVELIDTVTGARYRSGR